MDLGKLVNSLKNFLENRYVYLLMVFIIILLLIIRIIPIDVRIENSINLSDTKLNMDDKIHYLYWTGGFDSTYRLCEMLIIEKKKVQPIYVTLPLDNDCKSEESCNKLWVRRNRNEENKALNKIRAELHKHFPYTKRTLLPLIKINKEIEDDQFNIDYDKKFMALSIWPKKRKKHQYLFLSKFAYYHKKYIDVGVLGIHHKSGFGIFLKENLVRQQDNFRVNDINHPLGYLQFPLYGKTKLDLLETAIDHKFENILVHSWSCWFPKKGKPCGKCPMCKERIIVHPE